jgi:2',3'-cyclic-nucleotide 2'-phosphodiesterase (5'-nucleotidase family)
MKFITKVNRLWVGFILISIILVPNFGCNRHLSEKNITGELVRVDITNAPIPDDEIDSIISFYREKLQQEMNQVIAHSPYAMHRASPEGLLNNFVADIVFEYAKAEYKSEDGLTVDFCLLNYGGLRSSLPAGDLTVGNVFELMPFDNTIVVLTLSGDKTKEIFQYLATATNGMPISGLRMGISDKKPVNVTINGQPFDESRNYKIVTSDYLSLGGDMMNFFLDPIKYEILGMQIRDAILLHMRNETKLGKEVVSKLDGRLSFVN